MMTMSFEWGKNRAVDSICLDDSHYEYVYVFVMSPAEIKHEYYEKPSISVENLR